MLKIEFYLKKPNDNQESLEYITISDPRKVLEGRLTGEYFCELSLSTLDRKINKTVKLPAHLRTNPIDVLLLALEGAKSFLQVLINEGYTISDIENKQEWKKIEKKSLQSFSQEKIDEIKNNKDISPESKQELLDILKKNL